MRMPVYWGLLWGPSMYGNNHTAADGCLTCEKKFVGLAVGLLRDGVLATNAAVVCKACQYHTSC